MTRSTLLFVGYRLLGLFVTVLVASIVIFSMLVLVPGDPAAVLAGSSSPNPETLAAIRAQFRLDDPFLVRYAAWLGDLLAGDLGRSFVYRADVASLIVPRIGTSLFLVTYAAIIILVVGIGLGILSALSNRTVDKTITTLTSIGLGMPVFVVAILLITVFSLYLNWFPVYGSGTDFWSNVLHLTLPAISMSAAYLVFVTRITRSAVRGQLFAEHVDTARSQGLPPREYIPRHVLRNASSQIFSVGGITVASLFASTAVAEQAFGVSGIGSLLVEAASRQDLPVVQILSLFMVAAFVVVNTIVDLINGAIDPRTIARKATS